MTLLQIDRPQKTMVRPTQLCGGANLPVGQTIGFCGLPSRPEPGTRPSPLFFRAHESRLNRIALDVTNYVRQLSRRTNPMIVGLILPKRQPAAPQDAIGDPAGPTLQPTHNVRHRDMRVHHCVHMVWHNRPGVEVVGVANGRTIFDGILNHSGDTLIPQPKRPRTAPVEPLVANMKRNTACVLRGEHLGRDWRSRSREAPRYANNAAIRKPMGKVAAVKHIQCARASRPQETMVCSTVGILTNLQWTSL